MLDELPMLWILTFASFMYLAIIFAKHETSLFVGTITLLVVVNYFHALGGYVVLF
jgi:hypothetical protein